jgi:hypothetical protein
MNRNFASLLATGFVTAAAIAAAALVSVNAYADDITIDAKPFVSTKSRADVRAELAGTTPLRANDEWTLQDNRPMQIKSAYTSEQAKADYKVSRQYVRALTGEDSGSFFIKSPVGTNAMGGSAH